MYDPALKFNVTKQFEDFSLNCDAEIGNGITAIVGPSGHGKTTLLNCIAGVTLPDSGEIEIFGDIVFSSDKSTNVPPEKRRLGYVFQQAVLFPNMDVRQNIMYGYKMTPVECRRLHPEFLMELFELSDMKTRHVKTLSGGQAKLVSLARALATSPKILLLDEALTSLDRGFKGTVMKYLKLLKKEFEMSMIYVSHSMSEVMAMADNVLVLMDGRKKTYGVPSQVLVDYDVANMPGASDYENIIEAKIISARNGDNGAAELKIGATSLLVQNVYREVGEIVLISIRAKDIMIALEEPVKISTRNIASAIVEDIHVIGSRIIVFIDVGIRVISEITFSAFSDLGFCKGDRINLIINTGNIAVLDAISNKR